MNYHDIKSIAKSHLLDSLNLLNAPNLENIHTVYFLSLSLANYLYKTLQTFEEDDIDMLIAMAKRTPIYTLSHIDVTQQTLALLLSQYKIKKLGSAYTKTCILAIYLYIATLQEPEVSVVLQLQTPL